MNRAVKLYSVLNEAYGDSSFQDCKQASEEAIVVIVKNLQVYSLQVKLLEKLEQSFGDLQLKTNDIENVSMESNDPKQRKVSDSVHITAHEVMK
ncbi:hypothetical protein V6N13_142459 [Hibiscus sabdariffa]|uniref:Uncharacterized protein n=1 Tax=Hibiscus sabdariffa TaxID=183260 RepID=A0ABR2FE83_9ROSI